MKKLPSVQFPYQSTIKYVMNEEVLSEYIDEMLAAQNRDSSVDNTIANISKNISRTNKELGNMISAIKAGVISDTLNKEFADLEQQKRELETQLSMEKRNKDSLLTKEVITAFFTQLSRNEHDFSHMAIIDMFVNKVIIRNNKLYIIYNLPGNHSSSIDITELESSSDTLMVRHHGLEPGTQ